MEYRRYFLELTYNGTRYCGYQIQPNQPSIQEKIEGALSTLFRQKTAIVGCGRTDTGVHALQYYAHFDGPKTLAPRFLMSLNALVGYDIAIYAVHPVHIDAHARFDASARSYFYQVDTCKNPFARETAYPFLLAHKVDREKMQQAAQLLLNYHSFDSFCKTHTEVKTKFCDVRRSEWIFDESANRWTYHVTADRFLRGMIRLIVGMCLNVGRGIISLEELELAMEQKKPLKRAWSVPACGLFLTDIQYPYI